MELAVGVGLEVGLAVDEGVGLGGVVGVRVGGRNVGEEEGLAVEVRVAGLTVGRSDCEVEVAHPARKPAPIVNMARMKARLEKACAVSVDIAIGLVSSIFKINPFHSLDAPPVSANPR